MEELPLLIECARDGDVEAYGRVVRRFQDMAVGYMPTHCWGISTWPRTPPRRPSCTRMPVSNSCRARRPSRSGFGEWWQPENHVDFEPHEAPGRLD